MYNALIVTRRRKAFAGNIDHGTEEQISSAVTKIILSDICHTLGKIFPGSKYQITSDIKITTLTKPIIAFFLAIAKKRSDDFGISVADGEINLKLNKTVRLEDRVITWVRLQEVITMHCQLLDSPSLLEDNDFVRRELIG